MEDVSIPEPVESVGPTEGCEAAGEEPQQQSDANETEQLEKILALQDGDSTKSSMESSFTVTDCNCSSLIERTDKLDANELQLDAKVSELIEDLIKPHAQELEQCGEKLRALTIGETTVVACTTGGGGGAVVGGGDGSDSGVEFGAGSGSLTDTGVLQRALSNNSAGYASSCCGLDGEPNGMSMSCNSSMLSYSSDIYDKTGSTVLCGRLSTDYCASEGGSESSSVTGGPVSSLRKAGGGCAVKKKVAVKEPPASRSPRKSTESVSSSGRSSSRSRGSSLGRSVSLNLKSTPPASALSVAAAARERARSRDKSVSSTGTTASSSMSGSVNRIQQTPSKPMPPPRRPLKPDSLPTGIKDSPSGQRVTVSRTPSITRGRTPLGTPTDDGRWPSVGGRGGPSCGGGNTTPRSTRASSVVPEGLSVKTRVGPLALDGPSKASTGSTGSPISLPSGVDKFATLPRRRKERSAEDLKAGAGSGAGSRSNSVTREQVSNRMAMSLYKKGPSATTTNKSEQQGVASNKSISSSHSRLGSMAASLSSSSAAAKKLFQKTKIYHETSVQTAITCQDVEDAFGGNARNIRIDAVETATKQTQSDIRDKEMERLEEKLKKITSEYTTLMSKLSEKSQLVTSLEQKLLVEREEKLAAQRELQNNTDRVLGMLESMQAIPNNADTGDCDSLLMLESQLQLSGTVLEKKQDEIVRLQSICRALQMDMERSLKNQEELLRQKTELEEESSEMQDFLQVEKQSCMDALKEAEQEVALLRQSLQQRENSIERQQEECRHLVRISEQRRQEYLGMQAKYNALESRSKDILLQQGAAVSGASVALSGLGSRLDNLVEQLIASYNISEQDLEDVIYHNEAYTNSASSGDGSPEYEQTSDKYPSDSKHQQHLQHQQQSQQQVAPLSPQRGQSFIAAVISAIKNATSKTTSVKPAVATNGAGAGHVTKECRESNGHESDSTEMLDSETEPCLMMDNVLEDVTMPDSHSHNMVSSSTRISQIEMPSSMESGVCANAPGGNVMMAHDESLDNLSQAIANRQQIELQSNMIASGRSSRFHHSTSSDQQARNSAATMASSVAAGGAITTATQDHTTASHSSSLDDDENSCCAEASMAEMPSICEYCNAQSLVDQVIDVDNLITKLLKVLRIVQMDNDHCIQELINHKNKLAISNEEIHDRVKEYEELNYKLQDDLKDAYHQLQLRGSELNSNKVELVKHRKEIDKLNEDICQLSTLCSDSKQAKKIVIDREEILNAFKLCNEDEAVPEQELSQFIVQACTEIPKLKTMLYEKEQQLAKMASNASNSPNIVMTASWHQALSEAKRQYEAIDRALETLDSVKSIVQQTPALMELQRDLEETNFASASSFPLVTAAQLNHLNCAGANGNIAGGLNGNGNGIIDLNANETTTMGDNVAGGVAGAPAAVAGLQLSQGADASCYIDSTA
ncbi:AGAP007336-PA-like protein [Anopheles sinensis]|uniref:AGAP007336-PA-like protein n=1 Tax=Anopheles sinensis TaxID=74873 RepID=A0A084WS34_ANOSI|nr:AGAP007336-PA-like protein [Anopheles sinensis]